MVVVLYSVTVLGTRSLSMLHWKKGELLKIGNYSNGVDLVVSM